MKNIGIFELQPGDILEISETGTRTASSQRHNFGVTSGHKKRFAFFDTLAYINAQLKIVAHDVDVTIFDGALYLQPNEAGYEEVYKLEELVIDGLKK